ncbi:MAG: hypothetical protein KBB55_04390, partial [Candidatus Buchananbacteria bacterium]|nr:hypothetical protein [Candidatus Buchananbacteria bacterium]
LLTVNADGAHQSIVEAATFLELPFTKDIDLAFNQEALESLVTHARAVIVAQVAMCAALSIDQDLWMLQTMRRNFFLAYQPYMTTFHRDYILWANIRNRLQGLAWLVLMVTILVLVVRRDAALIVREELRSRGVTMNWWLLTRVTLSNWRFLIWPAAEPKMRQHIANQCEAIRMRRVHQVLRQQASDLWAKLQSEFEVSSIEPLYRIAINPQEPEGKRERSLMAMIETYHRWCKWQQTTPVPVSKTSDTPRQRSVTKVDRHDELRQAILSYTASLPVGSESWSMVKLQNLLMALATIKHQFGRPGVDVLCQHQNLEVLLDNRSMLMQAIRTDDRQIIGELLGLSSRHRQAEREVARPLPLVLSGKRLVIVASDRITSTKPRLEEAAYELGAKSVEFINSDNCGQVKRATGPETLVVLIRSGIGHAVSDSLKSQGIKPIVVNRGSATRFKQQVCQALAS